MRTARASHSSRYVSVFFSRREVARTRRAESHTAALREFLSTDAIAKAFPTDSPLHLDRKIEGILVNSPPKVLEVKYLNISSPEEK